MLIATKQHIADNNFVFQYDSALVHLRWHEKATPYNSQPSRLQNTRHVYKSAVKSTIRNRHVYKTSCEL